MKRTNVPFFILGAAGLTCQLTTVDAFHGPITSQSRARSIASIPAKVSQVSSTMFNFPSTQLCMVSADEDGMPSTPIDRPVLSLIDAGMLFAFAAVGKASHNPDGSLDFLAVATTAFPFLSSWFATAPFLGCYTPQATADLKSAVSTTAKGWILAVPLGCALRGIIKGYVPPIPFIIVTLVATLVLLSAGRAGYTALSEVFVELF